jgi:asparagine synthase (glutamine-hydrolysing)
MCGIAGILMRDPERRADVTVARRMADVLLHRGPDAGGTFGDGPVAFGHRRLRIIDLSDRAAQPMSTRDRRYTIAYNGEIYNYRELRRDLRARGVHFASESDTEVLLHLYAVHGAGMLSMLNGIFAFAVWDGADRRLFAARDHLGVKPLYYAVDRDRLVFASEIKALLAAGWPAALDEARVGEYLRFGSTAGESTLFRGVQRLPPGAWLEARPHREAPRVTRYFDVTARFAAPAGDAAPAVRTAIDTAVERQMVSDVPVGSMCSGGIDSSYVTALAARRHPAIDTFCIRIPDRRFDESAHGAEVARHCGTRHHELESRPEDIAALLPTIVWVHDEPLAHPNSVPIFQVSRLAREHVVVLLSGEGSDELFAGYATYRWIAALAEARRWVPRAALRLLAPVARRSRRRAAGQLLDAALAADPGRTLLAMAAKTHEDVLPVLAPDVRVDDETRRDIAERSFRAAAADPVRAALLNDQQTHLLTLLDRQDKMCMGTSIESRVPFLDIDVVRLANALPTRSKIGLRDDKRALRESARGALPESIRTRPKWPFGLPLTSWFGRRTGLEAIIEELSEGELVGAGVLDRSALTRLVDDVRAGRSPHPDLLWVVANLEIWMRIFISRTLDPDRRQLPAYREVTPFSTAATI